MCLDNYDARVPVVRCLEKKAGVRFCLCFRFFRAFDTISIETTKVRVRLMEVGEMFDNVCCG